MYTKQTEKRGMESVKIPKNAQDMVRFQSMSPSGIAKIGKKKYSATWQLQDIDYTSVSDEAQKQMYYKWAAFLDSFDSRKTTFKLTIFNRNMNESLQINKRLLQLMNDGYDNLRLDYNRMRRKDFEGINKIVREKYITVTASDCQDQSAAAMFFQRTGVKMNNTLSDRALNSAGRQLNGDERIAVIHDFYRCGMESANHFNLEASQKLGHDFRDYITPDGTIFYHDYFKMGKKYGRVLFLNEYAAYLSDDFLLELTTLDINMVLSLDIIPVSKDDAASLVDRKESDAEGNINLWDNRDTAGRFRHAKIPLTMRKDREVVEEYFNDIHKRDQQIFLCNVTIAILADTKEELEEYTDAIVETGNGKGCQIRTMWFQQWRGLMTCLPFGVRLVENLRTLTTESTAVMIPFNAVEINHPQGIPYGRHQLTGRQQYVDRSLLLNGNQITLGVPGSGKSMSEKLRAIFKALATNNDVIFVDPDGEYAKVTYALGGQVVRLAADSEDFINVMDISDFYNEGKDPVLKKTSFMISFIQTIMNRDEFPGDYESIIDRCLRILYDDYKVNNYAGNAPTLEELYDVLTGQPEPEAARIALALEKYAIGSFNLFAHQSNVDLTSRIICYDISDLDSQLKDAGMLVCLDAVWNRLVANRHKGILTDVILDELDVFFKHPASCQQIDFFFSRLRKYGGFITGIIQNVEKILVNQTARSIISNSEITVMMNQAETDAVELSELLHLSDIQQNYMLNAKEGCGLLRVGRTIVPIDQTIERGLIYDLIDTKPAPAS